MTTVFLRRGDEDRHERRGACVREQKGDHLQTKKKISEANNPANIFILDFLASKRVRKLISVI